MQEAAEPAYEEQQQQQQQYTHPASVVASQSPASSPVPVRLADAGGRHSFSGPSLRSSGEGERTSSSPDVRVWQQQAVAKLSGKSAADLVEEQRADQEAAFLLAKGIFLAGYAIKRGGGSTKFPRWGSALFALYIPVRVRVLRSANDNNKHPPLHHCLYLVWRKLATSCFICKSTEHI